MQLNDFSFDLVEQMKSAYESLHDIHQQVEGCREGENVGAYQVSEACEYLKLAICMMEDCLIKNGCEEGVLGYV